MDYSRFNSLQEFLESQTIQSMTRKNSLINEAKKKCKIKTKTEEEEEQPFKEPENEDIQVVYADYGKENTCIFKHIVIFTNDKDPKGNKTLKNLYDAIKALPKDQQPELHVFIAAKSDYDDDNNRFIISDNDGEFDVTTCSNIDTLIISRLGVQGEDDCEETVKLLQDRGFLVLNPIRYSEIASNKLETAYLLEKAECPQPRFCAMNKSILYDEKLYNESLKHIYDEYDPKDKKDKNGDLKLVVKILDGHGGTGVFMSDCKKLQAILQTIFAIDPEIRLIVQRKEEGDGGDIRVHVLTLRNKQVILACMKRQQLGGDFRSNVSLGAEAVPVKLTPSQEQIALKVAKVSKLPWCAVDIMHLVSKNVDGLEDVVLECNASPGTAGITEVIEHNFINVLLNELNDPAEFMLQDKVAGYMESVSIDFGDVNKEFLAKLDTGNSTSASTLEVGEFEETDKNISFDIDGTKMTFEKIKTMTAHAGEEKYKRPVIRIPGIKLGARRVQYCDVAIVKSREGKSTNFLMNRDILGRLGYVIHPTNAHILTQEMEKVKIIN